MTLKPCPRCKKLIPCGMAYCEICAPLARQALQEKRDAARKSLRRKRSHREYDRCAAFYHSKAWKETSKGKLNSCGWICEAHIDEGCTRLATEVHHIRPIQTEEGWSLRLDWNNLEAVCVHCHNLRHPEKIPRNDPGIIDIRKVLGKAGQDG